MQNFSEIAQDLSHMMEFSQTPIFWISRDLCITDWNKGIEEVTGEMKV